MLVVVLCGHELLDVRIVISLYLQLCFDVGSNKCHFDQVLDAWASFLE